MPGTVPDRPKLYHIVHVDRLTSIARDGFLFSDAAMATRTDAGTTIGMDKIKQRRLVQRELDSHPGLMVGTCVPFYFCPRSVMLYVISRRSHADLTYQGGQQPIVHLVFDLHEVVQWAVGEGHRWAFTLSNAAATLAEDRCDLAQLTEVNWLAMPKKYWSSDARVREGRQAEFLVEARVPWRLVRGIVTMDRPALQQASDALAADTHRPKMVVKREWYY